MTNLEIVLILAIWLFTGLFLIAKQQKADPFIPNELLPFLIVFAPIALIVAIIRQAFYEDWR